MTRFVYLIKDKDMLNDYGCFDNRRKAQIYAEDLDDVFIKEIEVK